MIRWVQYLRGVAALMVVWHHSLGQVALDPLFGRLPQIGAYGVDLFFMISGFIMLVTTWDKPITPMEFIKHRVRRVVPLYWLATLLMVGIAILAPALFKTLKWDVSELVESLFFIPSYSLSFPKNIEPLLVPGWSLNYEMFFYALFAGALFCKRENRLTAMLCTMGLLVAIGWTLEPTSAIVRTYTDGKLLEFGAGMILGRLWVMKKHARRDGGHAVLMALGDASYSIYLSHLFVLGALRVLWVRMVPSVSMGGSIAWMVIAMTGAVIGGWCCYILIEKPLTRLLGAKTKSVHPAAACSLNSG